MKAILIDPTERSIKLVEYDGNYRSIYKLIENGGSPFDVVRLEEDGQEESLFFDDEFLFKAEDGNPHDYFVLAGPDWNFPNPLGGKGLILGVDEEGASVATKLTVEKVQANVVFMSLLLKGWTPGQTKETDHPILGPKTPTYIGPTPQFERVS